MASAKFVLVPGVAVPLGNTTSTSIVTPLCADPTAIVRLYDSPDGSVPNVATVLGSVGSVDLNPGSQYQRQDSVNGVYLGNIYVAVDSPLPDGNVVAGTTTASLAPVVDATLGWEAFTVQPFDQPAAGDSVTVSFNDVSNLVASGSVFVQGTGWFAVTSIDSGTSTAVLNNNGQAGAIINLQA